MKLVLSVTTAPDGCGMEGQKEDFSESGGSFGRGPANQWILPDPSRHVSSVHGRVTWDSGKFYIEDTSTNGTYLNNEEFPVGPGNKRELVSGDILVFGDYTLQAELITEPSQPVASDETLGFALAPADSSAPAEASFDDLDRWLDPVTTSDISSKPAITPSAGIDNRKGTDVFSDLQHTPESLDPLDVLSGKGSKPDNPDFSLHDLNRGDQPSQSANSDHINLPDIPGDDSLFGSISVKEPKSEVEQGTDDPLAALSSSTSGQASPLSGPTPSSDAQKPDMGNLNDLLEPKDNPLSETKGRDNDNMSTAKTTAFDAGEADDPLPATPRPDSASGQPDAEPHSHSSGHASVPNDEPSDFLGSAADKKTNLTSDSDEKPITAKDVLSDVNLACNEKLISADSFFGSGIPAPDSPSPRIQGKATQGKTPIFKGKQGRAAGQPGSPGQPGYLKKNREAGQAPAITLAAKLGLNTLSDAQLNALPATVAKVVRATVEGLITALRARNQIKSELRMSMTMIQPAENNPLKFSITPEDALEAMFAKTGTAYLPATEAINDSFADLADHQIALFDAMQEAYNEMVNNFDPAILEEKIGSPKSRGFPGFRKGQNWENYKKYYKDLVADKESSFKNLFGEVFTEAYERRMNELKTNRKR
ncbi:MAG: type VI secretion system-associated FHA domain protein TagH [Gammaproteobacteria bacterium]|nr:MAG: type VI secretion system-associated FHA domain protein TagH [Pseudomonadota bacterium]PIE38177.1 MAG: type VI secretion system-associated FHA domain protein TagH [Gammaproteobacteria bacterium]